ncbi:MAG: pyrimidine dimer DNA glycosylase/endonuclease V [candidate division WOR-3 bacterium]
MRLWSIHPKYLDRTGLVALWREALLAQAVLRGRTRGYRHHPQLERFRKHPRPRLAIAEYLRAVWKEAVRRGYRFDRHKLSPRHRVERIPIATGQVEYEFLLLKQKVRRRDRRWYRMMPRIRTPAVHPLFRVVSGGVADWERMLGRVWRSARG